MATSKTVKLSTPTARWRYTEAGRYRSAGDRGVNSMALVRTKQFPKVMKYIGLAIKEGAEIECSHVIFDKALERDGQPYDLFSAVITWPVDAPSIDA